MNEKRITVEELLCYFSTEKKDKIKVIFKYEEDKFCQIWKNIFDFFEKTILSKSEIQLFKHSNKIYLWIPSTKNTELGIEFCSISSLKKCEIYVQNFEKNSQNHIKNWKDIYILFLESRRPVHCPDAVFLTLLNFTEKLYQKVPFFYLPDGLHWCKEDETLEINYSICSFLDREEENKSKSHREKESLCLFVKLGKYSLYDVKMNQTHDVEDEILLQMVNKICITL